MNEHPAHPFEKALAVLKENINLTLLAMGNVPWADFLPNPRRLRGSDFLMRWSQGVWSEERLKQAVNETGKYFAYRQRLVEEAKLRHELFERRSKQFDAVTKFVYSVVFCTNLIDEEFLVYKEVMRFEREISEMQFIFNTEIKAYVSEQIIRPSKEIQELRSTYRIASEEERRENRARQAEINRTLWSNLQTFQEKSLEYMQLQQPSVWQHLAALWEKIQKAAD
jgi:hypothetical protein